MGKLITSQPRLIWIRTALESEKERMLRLIASVLSFGRLQWADECQFEVISLK